MLAQHKFYLEITETIVVTVRGLKRNGFNEQDICLKASKIARGSAS